MEEKMRYIIKYMLREAVGVPVGIHKTSVVIYDEILELIKEINFPEKKTFKLKLGLSDKGLRISDMEVNNIKIGLNIVETDRTDKVELVGMSLQSLSEYEKHRIVAIHDTNWINLTITIVCPHNTKLDDIISSVKKNKSTYISSISHELKHVFDQLKYKYSNISDLSKYNVLTQIHFDIPPIEKFLYNLYFINRVENLVRPSELFSLLEEEGISKKEFYDFITSTRVYKKIKEIETFSYEKLKEDLKNYIPQIDIIFRNNNQSTNISDEEKIEAILKGVYFEITYRTLEVIKSMMTTDLIEEFLGFDEDKEEVFQKITKDASRFGNDYEKYYLYEQKTMNKSASKIKKKIAKLYSLTKNNTNESIINWPLYKKLFVKETKIDTKLNYKGKKFGK